MRNDIFGASQAKIEQAKLKNALRGFPAVTWLTAYRRCLVGILGSLNRKFCIGRKWKFLESYEFVLRFGSNWFNKKVMRTLRFESHLCRRVFKSRIGATKSPGGAKMKKCLTFFGNLEWIQNRNARFSASNNIDFWSRKSHMVGKWSSKIEKLILIQIWKITETTA